MKTYKLKRREHSSNIKFRWRMFNGFCSCVWNPTAFHPPTAYEKCENCLGFGQMPVPWRDLQQKKLVRSWQAFRKGYNEARR
jgi:hypothetical protein